MKTGKVTVKTLIAIYPGSLVRKCDFLKDFTFHALKIHCTWKWKNKLQKSVENCTEHLLKKRLAPYHEK
jgi:hypothetical protein